jgi:hypothetical protein
MPKHSAAKARASKLRERITQLKDRHVEVSEGLKPDRGPRPGESPNAYVERRMRETLKKKAGS